MNGALNGENLELKLCDMVAFQCALITLRGVSAEASEEILWQTLCSALVQQYGFARVEYSTNSGGEWLEVTGFPEREVSDCGFCSLEVEIEGLKEGRLRVWTEGAAEFEEMEAEREEQLRILLSEAGTMVGERRFRQRSAEALRRANVLAEAASLAKSRLLANVSHEIRTPLNGILGMTDLVLEGPLGAEQEQQLKTVKVCAESLLRILGDILDFSKLEAGRQELEERNFDPRQCVEAVLAMLGSGAKERGLSLEYEIAEKTPSPVWGDDARLRQVLVNLVGNAIKFTQSGRVVVRAWPEQGDRSLDGETQDWIHFLVGDTGPGVAAGKQTLIFAPFEQGDAAMNRRHGGTGLGLAICKQLVELMGGRIWVESPWRESVGGRMVAGSAFHFTLRSQKGHEEIRPPHVQNTRMEASQKLRILLAEDNALNRHLAQRVLERMGHTVITAVDGRQALEIVGRERVDLVLMDVQMPEMDGIEATREIRRHERNGRRLPIVALTAHAMMADRENCLAAGMNDYLTKPIRREELFRVIEAVAGLRVAGAA